MDHVRHWSIAKTPSSAYHFRSALGVRGSLTLWKRLSEGTSGSGSRNRSLIQVFISIAMRPALNAASRCPAVSLLNARKLAASGVSSSSSSAEKNDSGKFRTSASRDRVSALGWPSLFSYPERVLVETLVSSESRTKVIPRRFRASVSREAVIISHHPASRLGRQELRRSMGTSIAPGPSSSTPPRSMTSSGNSRDGRMMRSLQPSIRPFAPISLGKETSQRNLM